ncbi:4Fe-4S dicluster domain-containing protein [Solidesulfovibrio sp.]|uniref:4Fe-4S dicluster domain-containing protein n=1 Tax=Solidesulfovibrio sp. TaxID=2910990 RepID=UPI0026037DA2|nr:4Fe-4S dicluster domain-containing protein [Solidesulfovibrio sp.]
MNTSLNTFVVADPKKCIGCKVCEVACSTVHATPEPRTVGAMASPVLPRLYLVRVPEVTMPVQCRHCEDAPCANVCPVAAITQKNDAIVVDEAVCMGCKTCMMACPFGAIDLVPVYKNGQAVMQNLQEAQGQGLAVKEKLVASKCDMCFSRDKGPACVENCPAKALEVMSLKKEKRKRNLSSAMNLLESVKQFME